MIAHATVRTPADLVVIATCPTCEQPTAIRMQIGAELLVTDEGSELRIKGKAKGVAHLCDQLPLMGLDHDDTFGQRVVEAVLETAEDPASEAVRPLREVAESMGRDITIKAQGRTATIHGRRVDTDTGEILDEHESADARLRRIEREPDYVERLGTDDGQALLEAAGREADDARRSTRKAALS